MFLRKILKYYWIISRNIKKKEIDCCTPLPKIDNEVLLDQNVHHCNGMWGGMGKPRGEGSYNDVSFVNTLVDEDCSMPL